MVPDKVRVIRLVTKMLDIDFFAFHVRIALGELTVSHGPPVALQTKHTDYN